jgi:uncharacterized membrane protein
MRETLTFASVFPTRIYFTVAQVPCEDSSIDNRIHSRLWYQCFVCDTGLS